MYDARPYTYRPNTRKIYEEHFQCTVLPGFEVHHKLPVRLGGTHDIGNFELLTGEEHSAAHLALYHEHGDVRDLCAHHMISGRDEEAHLAACAVGGRASQAAKKERGELNGFQAFSPEKRKRVAAKAGRRGGAKQRDQKLGIHAHSPERMKEVAAMGGRASCDVNGWRTSAVQSDNGKRGGPKNKGFRWCNDGYRQIKYTRTQQLIQPFEEYVVEHGLNIGKTKGLIYEN